MGTAAEHFLETRGTTSASVHRCKVRRGWYYASTSHTTAREPSVSNQRSRSKFETQFGDVKTNWIPRYAAGPTCDGSGTNGRSFPDEGGRSLSTSAITKTIHSRNSRCRYGG